MKLLNNFVSLGYAALYSEALTLGAKAGLTPQVFDSVIRGGRMDCPFYQTFLHLGLERDPERTSLRDPQRAEGPDLSRPASRMRPARPTRSAPRCAIPSRWPSAPARPSDFVPMLSDVIAELNGVSLAEK